MSSVPRPDPLDQVEEIILEGEVANPANPPSGCYFHPRCRYAVDRCAAEEPALEEVRPGHFVKCHLARELSLVGIEAYR